MRPLLLPLVLLIPLACNSDLRSAPDPTPPPPPVQSQPVVKDHMKAHYALGQDAMTAIIRADSAAAAEALGVLAKHPAPEGLPIGADALVQGFQGAARQGADSRQIEVQARALAEMARACGGCHALVQARPVWKVPDAPGREPGLRAHMARHGWGMDRMYEGLVGPTESSWSQAAAIFNDEPIGEHLLPPGQDLSPIAEAAGERVHELGKEALEASSPQDRSARFAEAMIACATCHSEVGAFQIKADPTP